MHLQIVDATLFQPFAVHFQSVAAHLLGFVAEAFFWTLEHKIAHRISIDAAVGAKRTTRSNVMGNNLKSTRLTFRQTISCSSSQQGSQNMPRGSQPAVSLKKDPSHRTGAAQRAQTEILHRPKCRTLFSEPSQVPSFISLVFPIK
jgi:hypothetical protein